MPRFPSLDGGPDDDSELLLSNAKRPFRVPQRSTGGPGSGGGGGGGPPPRPTPPRPTPSRPPASAGGSGSGDASSSGGGAAPAAVAVGGRAATGARATSSGSNWAPKGDLSRGTGSSGGGTGGGWGGRGTPVVASSLALSWSEDAPGWRDVPQPPPGWRDAPPPPPARAAAAAGSRAGGSSAGGGSSYIIGGKSIGSGDSGSSNSRGPGASAGNESRAAPSSSAASAPSAAPPPPPLLPGTDVDLLSPARLAFRNSGAGASPSGRPPPDAAARLLVLPTAASLSYLDGTLPGDFGFDPLGLFDPANGSAGLLSQRWLHTAEAVHGRWAMLGAAGCLAPEYLAHEKVIPKATGLLWFQTGFLPPASAGFDYGVPIAGLFAVQMLAMGAAEGLRLAEYLRPGSLSGAGLLGLGRLVGSTRTGSGAYPGGAMFNPLGLGERPAVMREYQQAEVRHGRLAMLACLGYFAQAVVTGEGPYDNWVRHLEEPGEYNVLTLLGSVLGG
ncbi:Chlorophyll a-b binding protein 8, chloroplastic [Tetrabaena socialis]|uniref:Chlorophyll a-b binding protein, chloroplastic n=1 Tax=Tetrabaena socialis TaxID=47790 RepID=A0A2J7ZVV8_9CHLO|nr:Chlorophyll a-b binding protein 8, chloroplastic [Tetrabaena socialis]|eukprot:PNH04413.1 Chlorophyll a-b binding protein 8, chloroplastic [Tetrabaena socialis]